MFVSQMLAHSTEQRDRMAIQDRTLSPGLNRVASWAGLALAIGGALTFLINALLTPLLPKGFEATAASSIFLWRQVASGVAAALLLYGAIGLYLVQAGVTGTLGALSFTLAFVGSALLLAMEWGEVFIVRTLALRSPEALRGLEGGPGLSPYDLGAMIAFGVFTLGWLAFGIATLRAGILSRRASWILIAGFILTPMLGWARVWGAIAGNAVLAGGWLMLGTEVRIRARRPL